MSNFPKDVLFEICKHLETQDLKNFALVSKNAHESAQKALKLIQDDILSMYMNYFNPKVTKRVSSNIVYMSYYVKKKKSKKMEYDVQQN
jgi:hypothetical protein